MSTVMSIRLSEEELKLIKELAEEENLDKSTAVRELVEKGRVYYALSKYHEGKISIGKAAETAKMSLSEFMDLLAHLGIENTLPVEDYFQGKEALKKIFK